MELNRHIWISMGEMDDMDEKDSRNIDVCTIQFCKRLTMKRYKFWFDDIIET